MNTENQSIKEIPLTERPYEKCRQSGPEVLSDAELLAVILRSGTRDANCVDLARKVLALPAEQGLLGLHGLSFAELTGIPGIGPVKAVQLQCIGELCKRMADTKRADGVRFTSPKTVAAAYMEHMRHLEQENVRLLLLDSKGLLLKDLLIAVGTVNQAIVTPREVFIAALSHRAVNMILLHNHPSGDPTPSHADIVITKRIKEVGNLVGIPLIDHVILGDTIYISLKEQGLFEGES